MNLPTDRAATIPADAGEILSRLLSAHGKLWIPAPAPYVLRLLVKTASQVAMELRVAASKKRQATIFWNLNTGALTHGHYYAEREFVSVFRAGAITSQEMFARSRSVQMLVLLQALEEMAAREHPLVGLPWCGFCGRSLTDPESRARGIGPECSAKHNVGRDIATTGRLLASLDAEQRTGGRP